MPIRGVASLDLEPEAPKDTTNNSLDPVVDHLIDNINPRNLRALNLGFITLRLVLEAPLDITASTTIDSAYDGLDLTVDLLLNSQISITRTTLFHQSSCPRHQQRWLMLSFITIACSPTPKMVSISGTTSDVI